MKTKLIAVFCHLLLLAFASVPSRGSETEQLSPIPVSGFISTDTIWNDPRGYRLANSVIVRENATLTILSGVMVESNSTGTDFCIEAGATLEANGAIFAGIASEILVESGGTANLTNGTEFSGHAVRFQPGSKGVVSNSEFHSGQLEIRSDIPVHSNIFNQATPIEINPVQAEKLYLNTYTQEATVEILGTVSVDSELRKFPNLSTYRLINNIMVENHATLTIEPGVTIETRSTGPDFRIEETGTLKFTNATLDGPRGELIVLPGGQADILYSQIEGTVSYRDGSNGSLKFSNLNNAYLAIDSGSTASIVQNSISVYVEVVSRGARGSTLNFPTIIGAPRIAMRLKSG